MVDLQTQYVHIKQEIDAGIQEVIDSAAFIKGPKVATFQSHLEAYTGAKHVIPVGNGTDALQIALMGLGLQPGDEDLSQIPFDKIANRHLVVEEKVDGANSAVSFDTSGNHQCCPQAQ